MTTKVWGDTTAPVPNCFKRNETTSANILNIEHLCTFVVHPKPGKAITKYQRLADNPDPVLHETWRTGFGKNFVKMAQGDTKTDTPGMNTIFVLTHDKISHIPKSKTITYACLVVDFCPKKKDPNRVCMTIGGN